MVLKVIESIGEDLRDLRSKLYHRPGFQLPMILLCFLFFVI